MDLAHHGIKGQKWGVRRYQNSDGTLTDEGRRRYRYGIPTKYINEGGTIKKGQKLYRVGAEKGDPTALNRKYFSTTMGDHMRWQNELSDQNASYGGTSDLRYVALKDLKIASNTQAGKEFISMINAMDDASWNVASKDISIAMQNYPLKVPKNSLNSVIYGNLSTALIASQTKTGQQFVERMLSSGYDGIGDINGTDVSKDPVVIFNPDENVKMTKEKYWSKNEWHNF